MSNFLRKIFLLTKIIFLSKKTFSLPKKNKLLILDNVGSKKIEDHILGHSYYTLLDNKNSTINFPILLISFFNILKYKKYFYEVTFINYVNPNLALTWIDNSYQYCQIFKFIPSCKLGLIQNGRSDDSRFKLFKAQKLKCDYYFINGEYVKSYFEKKLSAKFIVSGSVVANNFNKSVYKKIKKIQWVSHYRDLSKVDNSRVKSSVQDFYISPVEFILPELEKFCNKNNITLEILGRASYDKEYLFYKNILKNNFNLMSNNTSDRKYRSYVSLSGDAIITGLDSQLLYEAFGLGYRVAFFTIRSFYVKDSSLRFAWPKQTEDTGLFWTNIPQKNNIKNILNYLISAKKSEWRKQVEKYRGVMAHDPGNKIIRKILRTEKIKLSGLKF